MRSPSRTAPSERAVGDERLDACLLQGREDGLRWSPAAARRARRCGSRRGASGAGSCPGRAGCPGRPRCGSAPRRCRGAPRRRRAPPRSRGRPGRASSPRRGSGAAPRARGTCAPRRASRVSRCSQKEPMRRPSKRTSTARSCSVLTKIPPSVTRADRSMSVPVSPRPMGGEPTRPTRWPDAAVGCRRRRGPRVRRDGCPPRRRFRPRRRPRQPAPRAAPARAEAGRCAWDSS